jgi:hypothetical protein
LDPFSLEDTSGPDNKNLVIPAVDIKPVKKTGYKAFRRQLVLLVIYEKTYEAQQ